MIKGDEIYMQLKDVEAKERFKLAFLFLYVCILTYMYMPYIVHF